ncbi:MAG: hypothetical protein KJZ87_12745 [Thermoguttaceae bacterium]|nr:hypothetical protein [Thermoguttaceae bacterium]
MLIACALAGRLAFAAKGVEKEDRSFIMRPIGQIQNAEGRTRIVLDKAYQAVKESVVEIEKTNAFEGIPVLDLKPYVPGQDSAVGVRVPDWAGPKYSKHQDRSEHWQPTGTTRRLRRFGIGLRLVFFDRLRSTFHRAFSHIGGVFGSDFNCLPCLIQCFVVLRWLSCEQPVKTTAKALPSCRVTRSV